MRIKSKEPNTIPTEDMETNKVTNKETNKEINKELNLCELLKGHEGETFFSLAHGEVTLEHVSPTIDSCIVIKKRNGGMERIYRNGRWLRDGIVMLFPSRALYEKYPLEPHSAWKEWQEDQKKYKFFVSYLVDGNEGIDSKNTMMFFRTSDERDKALEEIKAIIEKYIKQ